MAPKKDKRAWAMSFNQRLAKKSDMRKTALKAEQEAQEKVPKLIGWVMAHMTPETRELHTSDQEYNLAVANRDIVRFASALVGRAVRGTGHSTHKTKDMALDHMATLRSMKLTHSSSFRTHKRDFERHMNVIERLGQPLTVIGDGSPSDEDHLARGFLKGLPSDFADLKAGYNAAGKQGTEKVLTIHEVLQASQKVYDELDADRKVAPTGGNKRKSRPLETPADDDEESDGIAHLANSKEGKNAIPQDNKKAKRPVQACWRFEAGVHCPYGKRCRFSHEGVGGQNRDAGNQGPGNLQANAAMHDHYMSSNHLTGRSRPSRRNHDEMELPCVTPYWSEMTVMEAVVKITWRLWPIDN